jgi:8-oxo-dGTP diphosphatase
VAERSKRTIRCVGGLIHDPNGALLLVRRGHDPGRGLWSVPGGRIEPGESDTEAVVRELHEETGLTVRPDTVVGTVHRPTGREDEVFEIVDYACTVVSGTPRAGDDADHRRWVSGAEFAALDAEGALVPLLRETLASWNALPR